MVMGSICFYLFQSICRKRGSMMAVCLQCFQLLRIKVFCFSLSQLVQNFAGNLFDFSRLVSLFSHSGKVFLDNRRSAKPFKMSKVNIEKDKPKSQL